MYTCTVLPEVLLYPNFQNLFRSEKRNIEVLSVLKQNLVIRTCPETGRAC